MKKLTFYLLSGFMFFFSVSCEKEDTNSPKTIDKFILKTAPLELDNASKLYLDMTFGEDTVSRLLYENGDEMYINGKKYTLSYEGGNWYASGEAQTANVFYCCYAGGTNSVSNYSEPNYSVSFSSNYATTTGVILSGNTDEGVVSLHPLCAILVFKPADVSKYSHVKVGFTTGIIPKSMTVNASDNSLTVVNNSYFVQPSSETTFMDYLEMKKETCNGDPLNYFYIAVPIDGSSKSTKLYLEYTNTETGVTRSVTKGFVTLRQGKIYMIPDENQTNASFDVNGAGYYLFTVGLGKTVKFSAGNLQVQPQPGNASLWRFAPHQYDVLTEADNSSIAINMSSYIDKIAFGASGWNGSGTGTTQAWHPGFNGFPNVGNPNRGDSTGYGPANNADLTGQKAQADWGVFNSTRIKFGNATSSISNWRTLDSVEWNYLINERSDADEKFSRAIVNGQRGLVILPDNWICPDGCGFIPQVNTFAAITNNHQNNYNLGKWDKMERNGAIFLPIAGYRDPKNNQYTLGTNEGYYWTTKNSSNGLAFIFHIKQISSPINPQTTEIVPLGRQRGCFVRLVTETNLGR